ncbi:protein kinase [Candidatus Woesearchaeota archaeon]|nr:protein kinase [Candidatus Woesearchaeota archaeon]
MEKLEEIIKNFQISLKEKEVCLTFLKAETLTEEFSFENLERFHEKFKEYFSKFNLNEMLKSSLNSEDSHDKFVNIITNPPVLENFSSDIKQKNYGLIKDRVSLSVGLDLKVEKEVGSLNQTTFAHILRENIDLSKVDVSNYKLFNEIINNVLENNFSFSQKLRKYGISDVIKEALVDLSDFLPSIDKERFNMDYKYNGMILSVINPLFTNMTYTINSLNENLNFIQKLDFLFEDHPQGINIYGLKNFYKSFAKFTSNYFQDYNSEAYKKYSILKEKYFPNGEENNNLKISFDEVMHPSERFKNPDRLLDIIKDYNLGIGYLGRLENVFNYGDEFDFEFIYKLISFFGKDEFFLNLEDNFYKIFGCDNGKFSYPIKKEDLLNHFMNGKYKSFNDFVDCLSLEVKGHEVVKKLGEGGFGKTFKIKTKDFNIGYALKICGTDNALYEARKYELLIDNKDKIKNVVKIINFYHEDTNLVSYCGEKQSAILEELIDGYNLKEILSKGINKSDVENYALQILNGLKELNEFNLVHKDLKPVNIMIDKSGTIKLIDLGVSSSSGLKEGFAGNRLYAPPEAGNIETRFNYDVWSFGLIFYEMLTGNYLIEPKDKKDEFIASRNKTMVRPEINALYDEQFENGIPDYFIERIDKIENKTYASIIKKCLQINPDERYLDAVDVIKDFNNYRMSEVQKVLDELTPEQYNILKPILDRGLKNE